MAIETKRVTIGGSQYAITQLDAVAGRLLSKRFVNAMVPVLREVISKGAFSELQKAAAALPENGDEVAGILALAPIVAPPLLDAVQSLPDALFDELCDVFSENCTVMAGKPATSQPLKALFGEHFAGDYYTGLYPWFVRCLMVNGFLVSLGGAVSAAQSATKTS